MNERGCGKGCQIWDRVCGADGTDVSVGTAADTSVVLLHIHSRLSVFNIIIKYV